MSFYSSAEFYLHDVPPKVTANDLAAFLQRLSELPGIDAEAEMLACDVNWGDAITLDSRPFELETQVSELVSNVKSIPADFTLDDSVLAEVITALRAHGDRSIERAEISGDLTDDAAEKLSVPESDENDRPFSPYHWSLTLGPVQIGGLDDDRPVATVGLVSVSIHGDGYFFPWTFREWFEKNSDDELLQPLTHLCRETWPAEGGTPPEEIVNLRRDWEDYWPYDDLESPYGWYWGPHES